VTYPKISRNTPIQDNQQKGFYFLVPMPEQCILDGQSPILLEDIGCSNASVQIHLVFHK
jgi:hypothetical protein